MVIGAKLHQVLEDGKAAEVKLSLLYCRLGWHLLTENIEVSKDEFALHQDDQEVECADWSPTGICLGDPYRLHLLYLEATFECVFLNSGLKSSDVVIVADEIQGDHHLPQAF